METQIDFATMFTEKKELHKILTRIGFGPYEIEKTLFNYRKNGNRHGVVFTAIDSSTGDEQTIIIDGIYGEPNSTQVKDITYDIGADCDKRIILYSYDHSEFREREFVYDGEMAKGFAKKNNDCGVQTYILKVPESEKGYCYCPFSSNFCDRFNSDISPMDKDHIIMEELPTKQEFEQAEFSIFYNYTIDWDLDYITKYEDWFNNHWHLVLSDIDFTYPVWNEDGLFMTAIPESATGEMNLKLIVENDLNLLERFFTNGQIFIEKTSSEKLQLSIKLWDEPFSYFTKASVEEKQRIAKKIRELDGLIFEFWQVLLGRKKSDDEILNDYNHIPDPSFFDLKEKLPA